MYKSGKFLNIPNKYWEIQTERWKEWTSYFNFTLSWNRNTDHAGFRFHIEICGFYLGIDIYDSRHWNGKSG